MFVLWRLKEVGVRLSERRLEVGEVIYSQGDPDRYLYFLTEGVLKLYKRYGASLAKILTAYRRNKPGRKTRPKTLPVGS